MTVYSPSREWDAEEGKVRITTFGRDVARKGMAEITNMYNSEKNPIRRGVQMLSYNLLKGFVEGKGYKLIFYEILATVSRIPRYVFGGSIRRIWEECTDLTNLLKDRRDKAWTLTKS